MSVSVSTLGVAVVGLGVGEAHARAFAESPGCRLRVVYDLDGARADAVAGALGTEAAAAFEEVLADPAVDIVSIASFDDAHFEQALAALSAGKHVFVEKPLCRTEDEVSELRRAWEASPGLVLASNLVLRAAPLYRWLAGEVAAGALGRVYGFDGDYLYGRLHKITDGWRRGVTDYSVMLGGGIHLVDLMLGVTGELPRSVTAIGSGVATRDTDFRYDDFVAATFRFDSGLVGRITANFGCVHPHQHCVRVFGTEATVIYDDQGPRLHSSRDPVAGARPLALAALPGSKGDLVPDFVRAIRAGGPRPEDVRREFDVINVCAAAARAVAEGGEVDVRYS